MFTRSHYICGALALATVAPLLNAQATSFTRDEANRFAGVQLIAASQQLLDITGSASSVVVATSTIDHSALLAESMPSDSWAGVKLHTRDADETATTSSGEPGFWSSSTGRLSMVSLAGLAGAGYVAMNNAGTAVQRAPSGSQVSASPTAGPAGFAAPTLGGERNTIALVIETPEPATTALMALGLAALGFVARRRLAR